MLQNNPKTYFELKVKFHQAPGVRLVKVSILEYLADGGFHFVEEIVDGIDTATDAIDQNESTRVLPLAVYLESESAAKSLKHSLEVKYTGILDYNISQIAGDAWSSSWRPEITNIHTKRFSIYPHGKIDEPSKEFPITLHGDGTAFGDGQHKTSA